MVETQFKIRRPGKASLRKWHLSKELKKGRERAIWICGSKAFQQRKQQQMRTLVQTCLEISWNSKEVSGQCSLEQRGREENGRFKERGNLREEMGRIGIYRTVL